MKNIIEIFTPHLNANEDEVKIVEINYSNYDFINKGDNICSLESTKITHEVISESDGFIKFLCKKNDFVKTGQIIAIISDSLDNLKKYTINSNNYSEIQLTKKAQKLVKEHNIDTNVFANLNSIIKEKDILSFLEKSKNHKFEKKKATKISSFQLEISKNVKHSQSTNATTYMTLELQKEYIDDLCNKKSIDLSLQVSIFDLFAFNISKTLNEFPLVNSYLFENEIINNTNVNLGFTVEKDNKLFMPVIKNLNKKKEEEIYTNKLDLIRKVYKKQITPEDLSDGTISIASISTGYVKYHYPIIYPNQSVIIGIGSINNPSTKAIPNNLIGISLAYDHRLLNGNYCSGFLDKLIQSIELQ